MVKYYSLTHKQCYHRAVVQDGCSVLATRQQARSLPLSAQVWPRAVELTQTKAILQSSSTTSRQNGCPPQRTQATSLHSCFTVRLDRAERDVGGEWGSRRTFFKKNSPKLWTDVDVDLDLDQQSNLVLASLRFREEDCLKYKGSLITNFAKKKSLLALPLSSLFFFLLPPPHQLFGFSELEPLKIERC